MVTEKKTKKTTKKKVEAPIELANKPSGGWPKITQGTHLTVKTFEDGRTELQWDDEQLLKEVREAIASAELADMKPAVRAKTAKRITKVKETK